MLLIILSPFPFGLTDDGGAGRTRTGGRRNQTGQMRWGRRKGETIKSNQTVEWLN